jgi:hypothetical protein
VVIVTAAVLSCFGSARSLQIGDGVAGIAVTSVDRLGDDALVVGVHLAAFALILVGRR